MQLTVNGTSHSFEQNPSLTRLLEYLSLTGKRLAVECNGEIVPRSRFDETQLADGDKLEIVVAVGGG
ncbi:MAG: sulfur carrier protein ThiS [Sulfuricella sp.]|nr:sulfur carrier protein ThiS [Sulfuricella sp.]